MDTSQKRIMHVDDDPAMLKIVATLLGKRGFQVTSVGDPHAVLKTLASSDCRVVLLDIDMPGMSGVEVLEKIKAHDGGIQVIMVSGMVTMSTLLQSLRKGAEAVVFKPITDVSQLVGVVDAAFDKLDRWWSALQELQTLKRKESLLV